MISVKRQALFIISLIGIVLTSLTLATTYAYQSTRVDYDENSDRSITVNSGVLDVNFTTSNYVNTDNMPLLKDFLSADYIEFTLDNKKSNVDVSFFIELTELDFTERLKTDDFKYTLTEKLNENKEKTIGTGSFIDLTKENYKLKINNSNYININKNTTKTYKLYFWLKETEENQNYLENSYFKSKIKITSQFRNTVDENTLAYKIKTNNNILKNIDIFESDDTGLIEINNKYYFRGNVNNNYINYANMCFRIVSINNDNTIKLVLEDKDNTCENSIGNFEIGNGQNMTDTEFNNNMLNSLIDFQDNYLKDNLDYLKIENLCLENTKYSLDDIEISDIISNYNYLPKRRINGKILYDDECNGIKLSQINNKNLYVNEFNVDDVIYIGNKLNINSDTYLYNDYFENKEKSFWTSSLSNYDNGNINEFIINNNVLNETNINNVSFYRPTVTLINNIILINGNGTKEFPYIIK